MEVTDKFYNLVKATGKEEIIEAVNAINPNWVEHKGSMFFDRGGDVLAVAHLDTVALAHDRVAPRYETKKPSKINPLLHDAFVYKREITVTSINLDDRLGAWFILHELAHLGGYDILLTDGEEYGQTTSMLFEPPRDYNWVFEIDRHGYNNVVMYQYDNAASRDLLTSYGYKVENGSYSDISDMDHIPVVKFNFAAGYTRQHTPYCFTVPALWDGMIKRFEWFYIDNKDVKMPYVSDGRRNRWARYNPGYYSNSAYYYPKAVEPNTKPTTLDSEFENRLYYIYDDANSLFLNTWGQYSCIRCGREDLVKEEVYLFQNSTYEQLCVDCMTTNEYNEMLSEEMGNNYKFYNGG